jgi:allophanate hydrolase
MRDAVESGRGLLTAAASFDLGSLRRRFLGGELSAAALVEEVLARIAAAGDDKVWIVRVPADRLRERAAALDAAAARDPGLPARLPLFGIPFAVKDNIDVADLATTAGCPAFAYEPAETAPSVVRLLEAGALLVGKTNLDQFATGLVGTRSPYGVARNPFDPRYIPGGSSSGSAVAVAAGLVSFALGTDTAGSGRVPAAFNNIVGLKPTRGRISMRGVVPACRSLDCVSIFALACEDAAALLGLCGVYDAADPFARRAPPEEATLARPFRFAVPRAADLDFAGNDDARGLFERAAAALEALGGRRVEADITPCREAAAMLYGGPWVAERLAAVETLYNRAPEALLPVTRKIIGAGAGFSALDAFKASYRLAALRRAAEALWQAADLLLLPTAGAIYTLAEVEADPVGLNTRLGSYTNFVNLFDLAAVALPAGLRRDGLPFGVSLVAPAFSEAALLALGSAFQRQLDLPLGATPHRLPPLPGPAPACDGRIAVAVAGAHLSGMPLNGRLLELGASLVERTQTAPAYRMFLLEGEPARPGLLRDSAGGHAFEVELWAMGPAALGALVAETAPPLSIGTVLLGDGRSVKGFLCEAEAAGRAEEISAYGGWREYLGRRRQG